MKTGMYKIRNHYDMTVPDRWSIGYWNEKKQAWFQSWDKTHTVPLEVVEVGRKANFFKFKLKCKSGGHGWGKTGQRSLMCIEATTQQEAEVEIKKHVPGGWIYKFVGPTEETYYLKHL